MSRRDDIQNLITIYHRRLQKLREQEARHGMRTDPSIIIEIEDIEQNIKQLRKELDGLESDSTSSVSLPPSFSVEDWQRVINIQRNNKNVHEVVPELDMFLANIYKLLDFILVQDSYYIHHNHFIACRVKTPTIHLNLPGEFLTIWSLEEKISSDQIEQLLAIPNIMGIHSDFGLIFIPGSHRRAQNMINRLIRPAMKRDFIALGQGFLESVTTSTNPRTVLLKEILLEVDLTRISPFMAGGIATNAMFFGREGEIKNIVKAIKTTSIAITCGRRIGKTTLLNRLAKVVLPGRDYSCFFLNCQPIHNYNELLTEMAVTWERSDLPFNPNQPNSFANVVKVLTPPNGTPPIFLLDEVDEILKYDQKHNLRLFKQLRALSLDGRAQFIFTGERLVQAHLHDAESPLFNFFGLNVRLSFLEYPSVEKLVNSPLNDMQIELSDPISMLDTIFQATSGHPYLVQRLCQGLVQAISRQGRRIIEPEHIEAVLDDSAYQQDYFETVWGQAPVLARIITMVIGKQELNLSDIRNRLNNYDINVSLREIEAALKILDLYSVLTREKGLYSFIIEAFPEMMQRAYGDDIETNIELQCEEYLWHKQSSNMMGL